LLDAFLDGIDERVAEALDLQGVAVLRHVHQQLLPQRHRRCRLLRAAARHRRPGAHLPRNSTPTIRPFLFPSLFCFTQFRLNLQYHHTTKRSNHRTRTVQHETPNSLTSTAGQPPPVQEEHANARPPNRRKLRPFLPRLRSDAPNPYLPTGAAGRRRISWKPGEGRVFRGRDRRLLAQFTPVPWFPLHPLRDRIKPRRDRRRVGLLPGGRLRLLIKKSQTSPRPNPCGRGEPRLIGPGGVDPARGIPVPRRNSKKSAAFRPLLLGDKDWARLFGGVGGKAAASGDWAGGGWHVFFLDGRRLSCRRG